MIWRGKAHDERTIAGPRLPRADDGRARRGGRAGRPPDRGVRPGGGRRIGALRVAVEADSAWRDEPEAHDPREDQGDAGQAAEVGGLAEGEDAERDGADGPDARPDRVRGPEREGLQGHAQQVDAGEHEGPEA